MKPGVQIAISAFFGTLVCALLLFLPAGTLNYWQAWVFIFIFVATITGRNIYLAARRPEVLERRQRGFTSETRSTQKFAGIAYFVLFSAMAIISALDHRFGWSQVPPSVVIVGIVLVALGQCIAVFAVLQNAYASADVAVRPDQYVVSSGMYKIVRHPMYFGFLIMMIGAPLALDSYWGLIVLAPVLAVFVIRILDEEELLRAELSGYTEYTDNVRSRLVPYLW